MDYFGKGTGFYSISRELAYLVAPARHPSPPAQGCQYNFECYEEMFDCFEKMYKMDKIAFDRVKENGNQFGYADESKHPGYYTFTLRDRMLIVKINDFQSIANKVFGLKEGE